MTTTDKRELLIAFVNWHRVRFRNSKWRFPIGADVDQYLSTLPDEGEKCTQDKHIPGCKHEGTNDEKRITEF